MHTSDADLSPPSPDAPAPRRAGGRWAHHRRPAAGHAAHATHATHAEAPVTFIDPADGREWTAVEQSGERIPGARGPSCLCFQSHDIFRRVWRFPVNWRSLSDGELAALSRSW